MTLSLPKLKVNCGSVLYQAVQVERKPSAGRFPSNKLEAGYAFPSKVGKGEETTVTPEVSLRQPDGIPLRCQSVVPSRWVAAPIRASPEDFGLSRRSGAYGGVDLYG